jgi:hypothetical protein
MRLIALLLAALSLPASANDNDASSPMCDQNHEWDRAQTQAEHSYPNRDQMNPVLSACGLMDAPQQNIDKYKSKVAAARTAYCDRQQEAQKKYDKISGEAVAQSTGQICPPLQSEMTLIRDAKSAIQGLQDRLKSDKDEARNWQKNAKKEQEDKIKACQSNNGSQDSSGLNVKDPNCATLQQKLQGMRNGNPPRPGGGAYSIAEIAAVRDNPDDPCNKDKEQLHNFELLNKRYWDDGASTENRLRVFDLEVQSNDARLATLERLEKRINLAMVQNKCDGANPNMPGPGPLMPNNPPPQAAPLQNAMGTPPPASGPPTAAEMSRCVSGGCSKDDIIGLQNRINDYNKSKGLPIKEIDPDGIIGTQTANAWRAANQFNSSSGQVPPPGARSYYGDYTNQDTANQYQYKYDIDNTDPQNPFVIFKKGKGTQSMFSDYFK